jgi:hypothetical protein
MADNGRDDNFKEIYEKNCQIPYQTRLSGTVNHWRVFLLLASNEMTLSLTDAVYRLLYGERVYEKKSDSQKEDNEGSPKQHK